MLMQYLTCPKNVPLTLSPPVLLPCSYRDITEKKVPECNAARRAKIQAMLQSGLVILKQMMQLFSFHHNDILVHVPILVLATPKSNYLLRY